MRCSKDPRLEATRVRSDICFFSEDRRHPTSKASQLCTRTFRKENEIKRIKVLKRDRCYPRNKRDLFFIECKSVKMNNIFLEFNKSVVLSGLAETKGIPMENEQNIGTI